MCLLLQDEQLISHIIRNNLFKPVIDAFVRNGDRYNLLNSAVLDLLEHIRKVPISLYKLTMLKNIYVIWVSSVFAGQ